MSIYDTIFLDRDGTLNPDPGYISSINNYSFYKNTIDALKLISKITNRFCIITNQSGLNRGIVNIEDLSLIHDFILNQFFINKLNLLGIYYCPDHPDNPTKNRKPDSGMFKEASRNHNIILKDSMMIGDTVSDIKAGANLGMDTILVLTGKGLSEKRKLNGIKPTHIAQNIFDAAKIIESL